MSVHHGIPVAGAPVTAILPALATDDVSAAAFAEAVEQFIQHLPGYHQPEALADALVAMLVRALQPRGLDLFVADDALPRLVRVRCHPPRDLLPPEGLPLDCALVRFFQTVPAHYLDLSPAAGAPTDQTPVPLSAPAVESNPAAGGQTVPAIRLSAQEQLRGLGQELALPLVSRERLIGLVTLGARSSGPPFTAAEKACLVLLARAAALALDRLLDEAGLDLIGRISRGLAHDLQDLLTPISACVQLSLADESSRQKVRALLPLALQNLDLLKSEIRRARRLAGQGGLALEPQRLDELTRKAVAGLEHELARREMTVFYGKLPAVVAEVDDVALLRLLINLLSNAINASTPGSQLLINLSEPGPDEKGDRWVALSIADHGAGIAPEQLRRILAPPLLAGGGMEDRSGLGLAICRQIAALHGGSLELRSAVGQGTTAIVRLPLKARRAEP